MAVVRAGGSEEFNGEWELGFGIEIAERDGDFTSDGRAGVFDEIGSELDDVVSGGAKRAEGEKALFRIGVFEESMA